LKTNLVKVTQALFIFIASGIICNTASAQDNSPFSRYGIGDLAAPANVISRSMGGIAAGYTDFLSINYANPAAFSSFQAIIEQSTKKVSYGRAILDVGINIDNRTLREPNKVGKFSSTNAIFSHIMVGLPVKKNWGMAFGLRPISKIGYNIVKIDKAVDPTTNKAIDSAFYTFEGSGGTYYANIGTGYKMELGKKSTLAIGATVGYLFGEKDYLSYIRFASDSVSYKSAKYESKTNYGNLNVEGGLQFATQLKENLKFTIGAFGTNGSKLNAKKTTLRETTLVNAAGEIVRLDSVYAQTDLKGKLVFPSSYTFGILLERMPTPKKPGLLAGVDIALNNWDEYRFYGQAENTVKNAWQIRAGGQFRPVFKNNYLTSISYRAGFFIGQDYIQVQNKLPLLGFSIGLGLPILNYGQINANTATIINTSFEFINRGNNDNILKENMFRLSLGMSLSDFWFIKRRYE